MFEKSLYDLIRGLRNHKGREREYIQDSIRECRKEIRSQDMDLKATALLKLTYLEMFGHDMSWAAFNVLEVMSSPKYHQKRIGYLSAVQSFRPDTEVLMLGENQLKKDLTAPQMITVGLPLAALPHVINPNMANSLLGDLLPRLSHSSPIIRKKTVATLYRLALVYPETLRLIWPKIKERLFNEEEDSSVTASIINIICELGWRRPQDFLPLAPRLFDLLVQGSNNWMAIKIIKLFAALTPLEPRLIKKLLPPLTQLIKTTPAMSLLYECIHGIIDGGVLASVEGTFEGDELARLCVGKLREMVTIDGDPNLRYVALSAFRKIIVSHPSMVADQQAVILVCIDDADISIRQQALALFTGMVSADNITEIVDRLMQQLKSAPSTDPNVEDLRTRPGTEGIIPAADSDDDDAGETLQPVRNSKQPPPLPDDYRISVLNQIIDICCKDTYSRLPNFHWYIDTLVQLVSLVPARSSPNSQQSFATDESSVAYESFKVLGRIGDQLRNVAVRVVSVRREATLAARDLLLAPGNDDAGISVTPGALEPVFWIVGEYRNVLPNPEVVLEGLLRLSTKSFHPSVQMSCIQAMTKILSFVVGDQVGIWTVEQRTKCVTLLARVSHTLESLTSSPSLEVQERAVEFLEIIRIATEAAMAQDPAVDPDSSLSPPVLLSQILPSLFAGLELNPVAPGAQHKVPVPDALDLDTPINARLSQILIQPDRLHQEKQDDHNVSLFYHQKPIPITRQAISASEHLSRSGQAPSITKQADSNGYDAETEARKAEERRERYRNDPFYIDMSGRGERSALTSSAMSKSSFEVDSIPIVDLKLDETPSRGGSTQHSRNTSRVVREPVTIISDETIGADDYFDTGRPRSSTPSNSKASSHGKKGLLQVDSSKVSTLSITGSSDRSSQLDYERQAAEDAEMKQAMREVERLRLEMQRETERVAMQDGQDTGGDLVRRKKKKKVKKEKVAEEEATEEQAAGEGAVVKKKRRKKRDALPTEATAGEL